MLAASAESRSEHPLAKAIVEKAVSWNLPILECRDFSMTAGKGISAITKNVRFVLGKEEFITESGRTLEKEASSILDALRSEGKASVIVSDAEQSIGIIALSDVLRPEVTDMIGRLKKMGVKTVLLTGDHKKAAEFFAQKAGISEVRADLLPEQKVEIIRSLMEEGKVCMIGDGVNDAPALKIADVGVAMGAMGSDIAVEAADIALMTDEISKLPYLKWLSNTTVKTIRRAITLYVCINFAAITLSVLGVLTPTTGALVHNAGSCFVVLLAALLYDRKYH